MTVNSKTAQTSLSFHSQVSRPPRGGVLDVSRLNCTDLLAYQMLNNRPIDKYRRNLASNFPFLIVPEGSAILKPQFKDISGCHLTEAYVGQENSSVVH